MSDEIVNPAKRPKYGGRKVGTHNKKTIDNQALLEKYMEAGYKSPAEIAILVTNEAYDAMQEVKEEYGETSKEFRDAIGAVTSANKAALPYFHSQFIAPILVTTDEDYYDSITKKVNELKEKFVKRVM